MVVSKAILSSAGFIHCIFFSDKASILVENKPEEICRAKFAMTSYSFYYYLKWKV